MEYKKYNEDWQHAIDDEIYELRKYGGNAIIGINGKLIYQENENFIYHIRLYVSNFTEGAQIRIVYDGEEYQGEVLFASKFDIEVKLDTHIGDNIDRCEIFNEPWELLIALKDRLNQIEEEPEKQNRVVTLLTAEGEERHYLDENKEHDEIISRALYNPITYIWGPPGTGKTYTLTRIVLAHYRRGQSVLVLSHSNAAVDVLMTSITTELEQRGEWQDGEVVRYGQTVNEEIVSHPTLLLSNLVVHQQPQLLHQLHRVEEIKNKIRTVLKKKKGSRKLIQRLPQLEEKVSNLRMKMRKFEGQLLDESLVIGATLSKCTIDGTLYEREYDLVVVDEISMAYVPHLAFVSSLGKRTVVCGDFMQLSPIASGRSNTVNKWLKEDLFYHAGIVSAIMQKKNVKNLYVLRQQRRMHKDISRFTNHFIYMDEVGDHPSVVAREEIAKCSPFPKEAMLFLDVKGKALQEKDSKSRYNLYNALVVMHCILASLKEKQSSIGIVTPYRAQARLIQVLIDELVRHHPYFNEKEVVANTIHKFQGSERDIVLFDMVDSAPQSVLGGLYRNKEGMKLVNVAITRSRGKFIAIGNASFIEQNATSNMPVHQLVTFISQKQKRFSEQKIMKDLFLHSYSKRLMWFDGCPKQYAIDVQEAKKHFLLSCSTLHDVKDEVKEGIKMNRDVSFTAYVESGTHKTIINQNLGFSFFIIDERIMWLGIEKQEGIMVRLQAPITIKVLKGYLGIE